MDERTLNEILECSVCLDRLDSTAKVLPCQHTFCKKCLESIVASSGCLVCPECRKFVHMNIADLPPNVLLMRILEAVFNQKEGDKQQISVPHAYAIAEFHSDDIANLNFNKGDLIVLKRKIDMNWYVGELDGVEGDVPAGLIEVIVELPLPQCIALQDFELITNDGENFLKLTKGAIITVLRRVSDIWAEGHISNNVGLFPLALVKLNSLAKQILEPDEIPNDNVLPTEIHSATETELSALNNVVATNTEENGATEPTITLSSTNVSYLIQYFESGAQQPIVEVANDNDVTTLSIQIQW